MADEDDKKEVKEGNHINLKVVTQDGNEIFFKCKATTPLSKLMHAFCQRQGVALSSVRFLFDGTRINEHQTPSDVCSHPSFLDPVPFPNAPYRAPPPRAPTVLSRVAVRSRDRAHPLSALGPELRRACLFARSSTWKTVRLHPQLCQASLRCPEPGRLPPAVSGTALVCARMSVVLHPLQRGWSVVDAAGSVWVASRLLRCIPVACTFSAAPLRRMADLRAARARATRGQSASLEFRRKSQCASCSLLQVM